MKLPNSEKASVSEKKLTEYLLSETHAVGRFKSKFFRGLGFDETNADALRNQLLNLVKTDEIKSAEESRYGTKYIVEGTISTPVGKSVRIVTVWIIEKDKPSPTLITAYPA